MTFREIDNLMDERLREEYKKLNEAKEKIHNQYIEAASSLLKELHLDGQVINKDDGRIGELKIEYKRYGGHPNIMFHALTKKGTPGLKSEFPNLTYPRNLEDIFEPYNPDYVKDTSDIEEEEEEEEHEM